MKRFQWKFQVFKLSSAKQTSDITHPNVYKEFDLIMYNLKAIIVSRGYHIYKETSWWIGKINEEVKVELETNTTFVVSRPLRVCHKNKEFLFQWLENSRRHSTRNISLRLFFHQRRKRERFWNYKVLKIQVVPNSFRWIKSPSVIKGFC